MKLSESTAANNSKIHSKNIMTDNELLIATQTDMRSI